MESFSREEEDASLHHDTFSEFEKDLNLSEGKENEEDYNPFQEYKNIL